MPSIKIYRGARRADSAFTYNCASFDFENAVIDQDYLLFSNETSTYPPTGEQLKQIRFRITTAGINLLTDFVDDAESDQNLVGPPKWDEGTGVEGTPYQMSTAIALPVGEKPADWDYHYMSKYFTQEIKSDYYSYYNYISAGDWVNGRYEGVWHDNVEYYEVPNFAQIFYTDSTGFFGISRNVNVLSSTRIQENIRVLYNRRPLGSSYYPEEFWWKANGAFGQMLFYQNSLNYNKVVIDAYSDQTNTIRDYQPRMLVQMIRFSYEDDTYTGVVVIRLSADGLPQEAEVTALTAPFWRGETIPAKGGAYSISAGGNGGFQGDSNNRGDRAGEQIQSRVSRWNNQNTLLAANQNRYIIDNGGTMREVINTLWSPGFWQGFANNFFNPRDAIVVCHYMPYSLGPKQDMSAQPQQVVAAERTLSTRGAPIFQDTYTFKHVGDLEITDPHWYDGFPDFDNTAIYIHLPYIGVKQIDIEAVMEGVLSVDYVSDVLSGDVVATVWTQDRFGNCNYRYEFKGNCAKVYPLSSRDATMKNAIIGSAIKTGLNIVLAAATSDISSYALSAGARSAGKAAIGASNQLMNSVSTSAAGAGTLASNGASGGISVPIDTQCYLIIARPKWSNPEHYGEQFGYPSDIGGTINDTPFEGFLSCRTIVLNGISATDVERSEIASYMASGVFV